MTKLISIITFSFLTFGFSTQVYGKTIADVVSASCTSTNGGYLAIDTLKAKEKVVGQFGALKKMIGSEDVPVELLTDYPMDGVTALGTLAADEDGYWGNLSLLSPSNQQLSTVETLSAFFTDTEGNATVEQMTCNLIFN
jgi:hypothetical protein